MGLAGYVTLKTLEAIYYCPACLDVWAYGGHCWCEMRADVQPDASPWDQTNYPVLVLVPDQASVFAAYRIGGEAAVRAIVAQVPVHASPPGRVP